MFDKSQIKFTKTIDFLIKIIYTINIIGENMKKLFANNSYYYYYI